MQNKTAIITGGTGGLGRVVVRRFFEGGADLSLPIRSSESLDAIRDVVAGNDGKFFVEQCNLIDEKEVSRFAENSVLKFGRVDFLVNIAGAYAGGATVAEVILEDWEDIMEANLKTAFLMCRAVLPIMTQQKYGRIINIGSMQALSPRAKSAAYAVSKRGVITLTEVIAEEVKGMGITANVIVPSMIATDSQKRDIDSKDHARWVEPDEIAQMILFLCSDHSRSISGNTIKIYGNY